MAMHDRALALWASRPASWLVLAGCCLCAGCGGKSTIERVAVSGQVTLDGEPLPYGSILFTPAGTNSGPKAGGVIENGQFAIDADQGPVAGELSVEIRAPKLPPGQQLPDDAMQRLHVIAASPEALPARYNAKSELLVTATVDSQNRFEFALTSDESPN